MASSVHEARIQDFALFVPVVGTDRKELCKNIFEENQHRVYSLAFWMTGDEMSAEVLTTNTFLRAFATSMAPGAEFIDRALVNELRDEMPIGNLSLDCAIATEVLGVRRNVKRGDLERAVVQLPATERLVYLMSDGEGYSFERIARTVGINLDEAKSALHQARLRLREILAA